MIVRSGIPSDFAQISLLVDAAFKGQDESVLIEDLRRLGDMVFEFVALEGDAVIGHIAMSRLMSPPGCLALAPLAVFPDHQGRGVGSLLARTATEAAKAAGWTAAFVLGNPKYYGRFGYDVARASNFNTRYPKEFTGVCIFDEIKFRSLPREIVYSKAF